jgi:hypothetical protein
MDFLNYRPTLRMNEDRVFLSCKVTKINRAGCRSEVSLVLTRSFIIVYKDIIHQKKVSYTELEKISVSSKSSEFAISFFHNKDRRFLSYTMRDEIILTIIYVVCEINRLSPGVRVGEYARINLKHIWQGKTDIEKSKNEGNKEEMSEVFSHAQYKVKIEKKEDNLKALKANTKLIYSFEGLEKSNGMFSDDFEPLVRIGYENFGRVYLAQKKSCRTFYVMKIVSKLQMIYLNKITEAEYQEEVESIRAYAGSPFLVRLKYGFETKESVYYVFEYSKGQDLLTHLLFRHRFGEEQTKFYVASLAFAIGFLHNKQTFCPNLRLKDVYLDENGFIKLNDFRLCKYKYKSQNAIDSFFLASDQDPPEHAGVTNNSRMGDWWSLGILAYKMFFGKPPFSSSSIDESNEETKKLRFPEGVSLSERAQDFITSLLKARPEDRLGYSSDSLSVLSHPWFSGLDLCYLLELKSEPPFLPEIPNLETVNFNFL